VTAPVTGRRLALSLLLWPALGGVSVGATLLAVRVLARPWGRANAADVGAIVLLEAYLALLAALLVAFGGIGGLRERLAFRYTSGGDLALALSAWLASLLVGGLLAAAAAPLLGPPRSNAVEVLRIARDPLFVALVVPTIALLAPLTEELLFRGAFYPWLRKRTPVWVAAATSALVFAAVHLIPPLLPVLFAFGVLAALVRERTGSTLNTFAMHAGQNVLGLVGAYFLVTSGRAS
jgi:membrane protease YdiL (CAAX protease family)